MAFNETLHAVGGARGIVECVKHDNRAPLDLLIAAADEEIAEWRTKALDVAALQAANARMEKALREIVSLDPNGWAHVFAGYQSRVRDIARAAIAALDAAGKAK